MSGRHTAAVSRDRRLAKLLHGEPREAKRMPRQKRANVSHFNVKDSRQFVSLGVFTQRWGLTPKTSWVNTPNLGVYTQRPFAGPQRPFLARFASIGSGHTTKERKRAKWPFPARQRAFTRTHATRHTRHRVLFINKQPQSKYFCIYSDKSLLYHTKTYLITLKEAFVLG